MEPRERSLESEVEELVDNPELKRLIRVLSLAENGFFLLEVPSSQHVPQILDIIGQKVTKKIQQPVDIEKYVPKTDPNYSAMSGQEIMDDKIKRPFLRWVYDIQINKDDDGDRKRLFVIDGSQIEEGDRTILVDHFAFMNGLRDKIAGNNRGPVLVVIPKSLEVEKDIGKYSDLMSCCSGFFHINMSADDKRKA